MYGNKGLTQVSSERVKKKSRGSLTSFLGETHQDSGVACTSKIRELRIYYNTPNNNFNIRGTGKKRETIWCLEQNIFLAGQVTFHA